MKMLRKITDDNSLEISQENVYEGISFRKVTNLQCSNCNFAMKIAHHRYFLEYVPKTSCLKKHFEKKNIFRKKTTVDQLLNKVATLQYTALSLMKKNGAHVRPACRSAESSNIFTSKCLWWRLFSLKMQV